MDIWQPFSLPVLRARVDSLIERHYGMHEIFVMAMLGC